MHCIHFFSAFNVTVCKSEACECYLWIRDGYLYIHSILTMLGQPSEAPTCEVGLPGTPLGLTENTLLISLYL